MIDVAPIWSELLTLVTIGISGVAGGLAVGWRNPLLLAAAAVAISGVIRVTTTLAMWSVGQYSLITEAWWVTSVTVALIGIVVMGLRFRRAAFTALALYGGLMVISLATKYLFAIGERHHRDSVSAVETALLLFQGELDPTFWEPEEKRGLVYPLMIALGPDERLLASLTPLVFLSLLVGVGWLGRELTRDRVPGRLFSAAAGIVGVFSLTVPIFRVSLTYLNAHIFMALGVLLMVAGSILAWRSRELSLPQAGMVGIGVVIATTARVEGIVTVGVILAWLASMPILTGWAHRLRLFVPVALTGIMLSWWLWAIDSEVPSGFGVSPFVVAAVGVAGAALVVLPVLDRIRFVFFPLVIVVVIALMLRVPLSSSDPVAVVMTQFNNVVLGYGGWGVSALTLAGALVLMGWKHRSESYRRLVIISAALIFTTLFSKLFDGDGFGGGFGRDGFYDSVNRMWLHTLGVVAVTMVVGIAEFLRDLTVRFGRKTPDSPSPQDYTSTTVSPSKDPVS